jgi:hypothetical protein
VKKRAAGEELDFILRDAHALGNDDGIGGHSPLMGVAPRIEIQYVIQEGHTETVAELWCRASGVRKIETSTAWSKPLG